MSVDIGALADFPDRTIRVVAASGREIGIARWNGAVYAIHNLCVHQGGPVCSGILSGRLIAALPGGMELDDATPVLACPWHGWEFDVRTGRALHDPRYRLKTFPVNIKNGRVLVEAGTAADDAPVLSL